MNNNKQRRNLFLWLLLFPLGLLAQQVTVEGTVKDEEGEGLLGVSVTLKGTSKGVATNAKGYYQLKAQEGEVLVFSSVGFLTQEVVIGKSNLINVTLQPEVEELKGTEIVAVAYGTTDKKSFTGSMTTIKEDAFKDKQANNVVKALEGAVGGVQITSGSGEPGSGATVRIRGIGSINASSSPLIIIDGVPFEGSLNAINNSDVQSINVLKDASAAALYGARGANGVIIITTKSGTRGKLSISLDSKAGFNYRGVPEYDLLSSPSQYYETLWSALYYQNLYGQGLADDQARARASNRLIRSVGRGYNIYNVADNQVVGTDGKLNPLAQLKYSDVATFNQWDKALFHTGVRQEHNFSMSKGTEYNSFYFSLGYLGDEGYNKNSYFDRYATRFSYRGEITPWLRGNATSMLTYTEKQGTSSGYDNPFAWTRQIAPIYPIYEHDANGNVLPTYDYGEGRTYSSNANPVATQKENKDVTRDFYFSQSLSLDATLHKNLTFSATGNFYGDFYDSNVFTTPLGGEGKVFGGNISKYRSDVIVMTFNQLLRYNKQWKDYGLEGLLGHETHKTRMGNLSGAKRNLVDPHNTEWNNAAVMGGMNSYTSRYFVEGYFGQLTAHHKQKYFLSASLRRDASSVFAPEHRWGTFWSVGGSWLLHQEAFLEKATFLNTLKLKASYGVQGNDVLYLPDGGRSYVPYMTLYEVTTNGSTPGLRARYKGNRNITWEESANFNTGVELALWNHRFTLEADYFMKKTKDLLFNMPLPATSGFSSEPRNVADMENKGVDFTLTFVPVRTENFQWSLFFNGLHYKNVITKLPEELREKGVSRGGGQILKEGGSLYDFYFVRYAGVNPDTGDAQFYIKNTATGAYEVKGSTNYEQDHSRQYIGSAIPDLQGGFGTTLTFSGVDLSLQFAYQLGGKFFDYQYATLMHMGEQGKNWHTDILNRWTPENRYTDVPRLEYANQKLLSASDRFVVEASYLSLKNISLGYTLPQEVCQRLHLSKLRYYITADNVYLWSKRRGLDPRSSISGAIGSAVYSPIRTVSLGISLTL